jgi:hypothetical protein
VTSPEAPQDPPRTGRRPLYPRLLRLRHVRPNGWQRAVLGEGAIALAAVLVLADVASAWTLLVLPLGVAALVKAHDVLAGLLAARPPADGPRPGSRTGPGADDDRADDDAADRSADEATRTGA